MKTTGIKPIICGTDFSEGASQAAVVAVNTAAHRQLELAGLVPERHVLEGEPKPRLLEYAESWNADCLLIGASGLQHPATETLGAVAAVRAPCSVEIVRP